MKKQSNQQQHTHRKVEFIHIKVILCKQNKIDVLCTDCHVYSRNHTFLFISQINQDRLNLDSEYTSLRVRALASRSKAHAHVNAPSPFQPVSSQPRAD